MKKIIIIFCFSFFLTSCCIKSTHESKVKVEKNDSEKYKYKILLKGKDCLRKHGSDPISAIFSFPETVTVYDYLEINELYGTFMPHSFRIKNELGNSFPKGTLTGFITLGKNKLIIKLNVKKSKDRFDPYFFNGSYLIERK